MIQKARGRKHFKTVLATVLTILVISAVPAFANENNEDNEHGFLEELSETLGVGALLGLIALNSLYYYSMAYRQWPASRQRLPEIAKIPLRWKGRVRRYHYRGNPIITGIGFLHGIWAEHDHFILWCGWGLLVFLCVSGFIMKIQGADQPGAKASRLIHGQHIFSIAMVILLLIGHALVED